MYNLNFNQCNTGSYYPPLLNTVRSQVISLFNSNTTTIINPTISASWIYANFISPQNVWPSSNLLLTKQAGAGLSITDNLDGSFLLGKGTYQVEFNAQGQAGQNAQLSLLLNGVVEGQTEKSTSADGQLDLILGRAVFSVDENGGLLSLINSGRDEATIRSASITISRLN